MPLDPVVAEYLKKQAALNAPPIMEVPVELSRESMRADSNGIGHVEPVRQVVDIPLTGPNASFMARMYTPFDPETSSLNSAVVFYHGGGWVTGDLDTHDRLCRRLANRGSCLVLSVDYRRAPEDVFPAAVEDAGAAYRWLAGNAHRHGVDAGKISVMGDSAGGNLAAAVALTARNNLWPSPATQILVYPITDCDFETESYNQFAQGFGLTKQAMRWFWDQYVPDESQRTHPYVSPLREANLSALCPALILTAEFDPLRDEGESYAKALRRQNVPTQLVRYDGQIHGFLRRPGLFAAADMALSLIAAVVRSGKVEHSGD